MEWEVNKGNPDSERRQLNRILDEINQTIVAIPGGVVDTVVAGSGIAVDSTDAANPIVALSPATISTLGTALQPGDNVSELVNDAGYSTTTGTVTSVAVAGTDGIEVDSGSPVTGAGTIQLGLSAAVLGQLADAASAVQPGDNISVLTNDAGYTTNTGTVTSVDLGASTGLTPSGGPVTGAGTLTYTLSANLQSWHGIAPATKLDAASYTAADVLAKILTVDGIGSGLDADLLDGQSSAHYHNAANLTGTIADARLSSNVPLKDAANTWSTTQTFSVAPVFTDAAGTRTALGLGTGNSPAFTAVTLTGDLTAAGISGLAGSTSLNIYQPTADGADNSRVAIMGGATQNAGRGAFIQVHGLEYAGSPGVLGLTAGTGANIELVTSGGGVIRHNGTAMGTAAYKNTGTSGDAVPLLNAANTWSTTQTLSVAPIFTDAAGTRTALGLGTAATQNTGTSGATVPLLNGNNTHSGLITFSQEITVNDTGSIFQLSGSTLPAAASSTITTFARSTSAGAQAAISIISGNTSSVCGINFGDTDSENSGRIHYDHSTETFSWRANATNNILQLSSTALTASTSRYDTGIESPASWAANVNDLALGSSTRILRVSGTAARDFTGMVPAGGGRRILVCNVGSFDIVIKHQNAGSTAANRFICPGNVDFTLNQSDSVEVWYDTTSSRWRVIGF